MKQRKLIAQTQHLSEEDSLELGKWNELVKTILSESTVRPGPTIRNGSKGSPKKKKRVATSRLRGGR